MFAIKGSDTQSVALNQGTPVDIKKGKGRRAIRRATKLFTVGVSGLKAELYGWLKMEPPEENELEPTGFCHFPQYSEEHFKRLTSETLETKWVKGRKKYQWVADGRNEQLDCRIYARAAACFFGIDRFKDPKWTALEAEVGTKNTGQSDKNVQKSEKKQPRVTITRRKSKFM